MNNTNITVLSGGQLCQTHGLLIQQTGARTRDPHETIREWIVNVSIYMNEHCGKKHKVPGSPKRSKLLDQMICAEEVEFRQKVIDYLRLKFEMLNQYDESPDETEKAIMTALRRNINNPVTSMPLLQVAQNP